MLCWDDFKASVWVGGNHSYGCTLMFSCQRQLCKKSDCAKASLSVSSVARDDDQVQYIEFLNNASVIITDFSIWLIPDDLLVAEFSSQLSHLVLSWTQAQLFYREPQSLFIGRHEMLAELTAFNVTTDSIATEPWPVCICGWFWGWLQTQKSFILQTQYVYIALAASLISHSYLCSPYRCIFPPSLWILMMI